MPCKLPSHIFEVDDATALRLSDLTIRRRKTAAVFRAGLMVVSIALAGIAVAASL